MKNKTVKLLSGIAVLAVLLAAYGGISSYVSSQEEKEAQEADTSVALVEMDSDKIDSVSFLSTKGNSIVFEKKEGKWVNKNEEDFPVSQDTLTSAVSSLSSASADRALSNPESLSEYDLDAPQNEISLTDQEGNEICLQIGMKNESTSQYYVMESGKEQTVYLVSSTLLDPFMDTEYAFAEAEAFPSITSSTLENIAVEQNQTSYELSKDPDTLSWFVSDGQSKEQADSSKAGSVTSAIGSLTYGDFVDYNCTDPAEYGFDDPYAVITASSPEEQLVIYIGDKTEESRYVKVNDSTQVYTVQEDSLSDILDKKISDFYSMTVHYLSVNQLESLEVLSEDGTHQITVIHTEDETDKENSETNTDDASEDSTSQPELSFTFDGSEIEQNDFTAFYNKLINLTAQQRLTEEYTPKTEASLTFRFTDTEGQETVVSCYEYDSSFYAVTADQKVYLVNKMNIKDLEEAYSEMLNTCVSQ